MGQQNQSGRCFKKYTEPKKNGLNLAKEETACNCPITDYHHSFFHLHHGGRLSQLLNVERLETEGHPSNKFYAMYRLPYNFMDLLKWKSTLQKIA